MQRCPREIVLEHIVRRVAGLEARERAGLAEPDTVAETLS